MRSYKKEISSIVLTSQVNLPKKLGIEFSDIFESVPYERNSNDLNGALNSIPSFSAKLTLNVGKMGL